MDFISAIALTDIEYNGKNGRSSAKKDSVISDLTEQECLALEALKSVRRLTTTSNAQSQAVPSRTRRRKRGR